jgi:hypothetical protein
VNNLSSNSSLASWLDKAQLSISAIFTATIVFGLLYFSRFGYEFTDESFYLIWMDNPFNYKFSVSQFGFVYHPIYKLVNQSIGVLRQMNILLIFGLAWIACRLFIGRFLHSQLKQGFGLAVVSAAFATSALVTLVFAGMWLSTPSYNSLAFTGLLIIAIGILQIDVNLARSISLGCVVVGVGGWLSFMAKPTTAVAAGIIVVLYALLAARLHWRFLFSPLTFILLMLASAYSIDGSLQLFVDRIRGGLELGNILIPGGGFSKILRYDSLYFQNTTFWMLWFSVLICSVLGIVSIRTSSRARLFVALTQILVCITGLLIFCGILVLQPLNDVFLSLLLGTVPLAAVLISVWHCRIQIFHPGHRDQWACAVTFLLMPVAYALGSSNNYWILIGSAAFFLVMVACAVLLHLSKETEFMRLLSSLAIMVQAITAIVLAQGLDSPYRQQGSLRKNDFMLDLGQFGGELILKRSTGEYILQAKYVAARSGFSKGMPMIDMTGHAPGLLFQLGADSVGVAWTLGGYPGSKQFVEMALKSVPCDKLAVAWLLSEPQGMAEIPSSVLSTFGADLKDSFENVGTIVSPDGHLHQLLKPNRSQYRAENACKFRRGIKI